MIYKGVLLLEPFLIQTSKGGYAMHLTFRNYTKAKLHLQELEKKYISYKDKIKTKTNKICI